MRHASKFIFGPYSVDADASIATFRYATEFADGTRLSFTDTLSFPEIASVQWERIDANVLRNCLQSLSLVLGINYWKLHCAPLMHIENFSLDREQADFWTTVYTTGLAEFFFRSRIDFRGLVVFPSSGRTPVSPPRSGGTKTLLTLGGGKDSIVAAEMLKHGDVPFDVLALGSTRIQTRVAHLIGRPFKSIVRTRDPLASHITKRDGIQGGYPFVCMVVFEAALYAALGGYKYIVLANEQSADIGNVPYLGIDVNHQWSKSSACEEMLRGYIARYLDPGIIPFSLIRSYTEIEMARQFAHYPQYFNAFSSCNMNFHSPRSITDNVRPGHAYWCNKCPKCVFLFACLAAFVPKETVVDIFGANLHADATLAPMYRQLLGLEGIKPFDCIGTPEEMIVAMHRGDQSDAYKGDVCMDFFAHEFAHAPFAEMEQRVFAPHTGGMIPLEFRSLLHPA